MVWEFLPGLWQSAPSHVPDGALLWGKGAGFGMIFLLTSHIKKKKMKMWSKVTVVKQNFGLFLDFLGIHLTIRAVSVLHVGKWKCYVEWFVLGLWWAAGESELCALATWALTWVYLPNWYLAAITLWICLHLEMDRNVKYDLSIEERAREVLQRVVNQRLHPCFLPPLRCVLQCKNHFFESWSLGLQRRRM